MRFVQRKLFWRQEIKETDGPVRNNGGGHVNHTMFWKIIGPKAGGAPSGRLAPDSQAAFGSFDAFKEEFEAAGLGRFAVKK